MARFKSGNVFQKYNSESLTSNKILSVVDAQMQFLNPNGSDRILYMPTGADILGVVYCFANTGTANNIRIQPYGGGNVIVTLKPGENSFLNFDGISWQLFSGSLSTMSDVYIPELQSGDQILVYNPGFGYGYGYESTWVPVTATDYFSALGVAGSGGEWDESGGILSPTENVDVAIKTNKKLYLDEGSDTYFVFDGTSVHLYINGSLVRSFS